jgi:hypothetical protein
MGLPMTGIAKRDEILFRVITQVTAFLDVMNLEISRRSALLASPTIAFKDLVAQFSIGILVESESRMLGT